MNKHVEWLHMRGNSKRIKNPTAEDYMNAALRRRPTAEQMQTYVRDNEAAWAHTLQNTDPAQAIDTYLDDLAIAFEDRLCKTAALPEDKRQKLAAKGKNHVYAQGVDNNGLPKEQRSSDRHRFSLRVLYKLPEDDSKHMEKAVKRLREKRAVIDSNHAELKSTKTGADHIITLSASNMPDLKSAINALFPNQPKVNIGDMPLAMASQR